MKKSTVKSVMAIITIGGLVILAILLWQSKKSTDKQLAEIQRSLTLRLNDQSSMTDSRKAELAAYNSEPKTEVKLLTDDARNQIKEDIGKELDRGMRARHGARPKNPSIKEIERLAQDVMDLTEQILDSKYNHVPKEVRSQITHEIVDAFKKDMMRSRNRHNEEGHIKQLEELSNEELEIKAQKGDFYSQYVLGVRIRDTIDRWKAGSCSAKEGKAYDADIWTGHNGQVGWNRLQKLASEGNDYARYSMEEWVNSKEGDRQRTKALKDYRLLDYAGQLLLSAAEGLLATGEDDYMKQDKLYQELVSWRRARLFFHSPINEDPDFCRRWKAVAKKLELSEHP